MKFLSHVILGLIGLSLKSANAQVIDFGFEGGGEPSIASYHSWYFGAEGYETLIDSSTFRSGTSSLRTKQKYEVDDIMYQGLASHLIPEKLVAGKEVEISSWIKAEKANAKAGIRLFGYADNWELITRVYKDTVEIKGNIEWTKITLKAKVHQDVKQVMFQLKFKGEGTAWFDDVTVTVNGEKYKPTDAQKFIVSPTQKEIEWLQNNVIPFKSTDINDDLSDLSFVKSLIGDARVVAMGEATHGTSEHLTVKNRMIRYLITELGFNAVVVEADMTAVEYVNNYVLHGAGDAKEVLNKLRYWSLRNEEVLGLVEWMRKYNTNASRKVHFRGIDIQGMKYTLNNLMEFVRKSDYPLKQTFFDEYATIERLNKVFQKNWYRTKEKRPLLVDSSLEISGNWLQTFQNANANPWILQNVRLVNQFVETVATGRSTRDKSMAENVIWLQKEHEKIIVWAHNAHVKKSNRYNTLGSSLANTFKDFISVGFTMNQGKYLAYGETGLDTFSVQPILHNSYEMYFSKADIPLFALDLRKASKNELASKWLTETKFGRDVGAHGFISTGYYPFILSDDFDIMIYTESTKPTTVLKR